MASVLTKSKGFFQSGAILANIGILLAALDQLAGQLESIQPLLPPKAAAAVVGALSVIAIIKRVTATAKIFGLF